MNEDFFAGTCDECHGPVMVWEPHVDTEARFAHTECVSPDTLSICPECSWPVDPGDDAIQSANGDEWMHADCLAPSIFDLVITDRLVTTIVDPHGRVA